MRETIKALKEYMNKGKAMSKNNNVIEKPFLALHPIQSNFFSKQLSAKLDRPRSA